MKLRKLLRIFLSMLLVFSCFNISTNTVKADTTKGNTLTLNAKISDKCKEYVELAGKDLYSVAGAEYTVKDEDNKVVGVFVIDENGVGTVKGTTDKALILPDGKYSIELTKQPNDKAVFGLTDEGQIKYVTLTSNTPKPTTINVDTVAVLYGYNSSGNTFSNNQYKLWRTTYGTGIFECGIAQVDAPCSIASFGSHSLNVADAHVLDRNSTTDAGFSAEMIYKIMYYGRSGPSQWSGFSGYKKPWMDYGSRENSGTTEALAAFVTHVALSRAWGRDRNKWSLQADIAGFYSFWNYVNNAANAPDDFVVYVWEHSKVHSSEQDMFFGYTLANTDYDSENVVMELMTDYDPVSVVLTKSNTSSEKIADAEFTMKYYNSVLENVAAGDETDPERTWVFKTNDDGLFSYLNYFKVSGDDLFVNPTTNDPILLPGTYIVSETKVPTGYVKSEDFMIRVDTNIGNSISYYHADGKTKLLFVNVENGYELTEYKEAYLNLHKSSLSELATASLKGAVYNVYLDEFCTVQAKINNSSEYAVLTVGENGISNSVALAPNKYYIKEIQEPRGYMLNATVYAIELEEKETVTIEAEDEAILYKAAKIDVNGDYVQNAILQLYEGNTLLYEFTTTNEPTDISAYLYQGKTYHLHEKQEPKGYLKSEDVYFTVAAIKGEYIVVSMTDEFQPKIKTVATFEDGRKNNPVSDDRLRVIDEVTINDLVVDKAYFLVGFIYDTTDLDNHLYIYDYEFTAKNSEEIIKTEFFIASEEGKDYVVYEYLYDRNLNLLASHTDPNDKDQIVSCPKITKIIVIKSDALDNTKHLKDCEITVFNKDGSIAQDAYGNDAIALTDKDGKVEFDIFFNEEGYYVQETKAPKGYRINKDKFEVSLESTVIEIKVNDMALPAVAFTGDIQYLSLIVSVCFASAVLVVLMIYKKKKALKQN